MRRATAWPSRSSGYVPAAAIPAAAHPRRRARYRARSGLQARPPAALPGGAGRRRRRRRPAAGGAAASRRRRRDPARVRPRPGVRSRADARPARAAATNLAGRPAGDVGRGADRAVGWNPDPPCARLQLGERHAARLDPRRHRSHRRGHAAPADPGSCRAGRDPGGREPFQRRHGRRGVQRRAGHHRRRSSVIWRGHGAIRIHRVRRRIDRCLCRLSRRRPDAGRRGRPAGDPGHAGHRLRELSRRRPRPCVWHRGRRRRGRGDRALRVRDRQAPWNAAARLLEPARLRPQRDPVHPRRRGAARLAIGARRGTRGGNVRDHAADPSSAGVRAARGGGVAVAGHPVGMAPPHVLGRAPGSAGGRARAVGCGRRANRPPRLRRRLRRGAAVAARAGRAHRTRHTSIANRNRAVTPTRWHWRGTVALLAVALAFVIYPLIEGPNDIINSDWPAFATGARLIVQDPGHLYDLDRQKRVESDVTGGKTLITLGIKGILPFLAPAWVALIAVPFEALGTDLGGRLWILFGLAGLALGAYLAVRPRTPAAILPAFASVPTALMLLNAQVDGLVVLGIGAALALRSRQYVAGFALGLTLVKPQLVLPLGAALVLARRWRVLAGWASAGALLWASVAVLNPRWVLDWLAPTSTTVTPGSREVDLPHLATLLPATWQLYAVATLTLLTVAGVVLVARQCKNGFDGQTAILVAGGVLAAPHALPADLVLVGLALAIWGNARWHDWLLLSIGALVAALVPAPLPAIIGVLVIGWLVLRVSGWLPARAPASAG